MKFVHAASAALVIGVALGSGAYLSHRAFPSVAEPTSTPFVAPTSRPTSVAHVQRWTRAQCNNGTIGKHWVLQASLVPGSIVDGAVWKGTYCVHFPKGKSYLRIMQAQTNGITIEPDKSGQYRGGLASIVGQTAVFVHASDVTQVVDIDAI